MGVLTKFGSLISFELAILAENKGYPQSMIGDNRHHYNQFGHLDGTILFAREWIKERELKGKDCFMKSYAAPTQSVLQAWLRDNHNLNINIKHRTHSQTYCFNITSSYHIGDGGELYSELYTKFDKYEDALEKALKEALSLI